MTKQMSPIQASQILQSLAQNDNVMSYLLGRVTGDPEEAFRVAIAALRGPEPDPDTGLMKCDYCNGSGEQKPLFHENNYEPHTRMQSYIEISESSYGKKPLICVDLWDGANACAAFEINYCPMCGRKLGEE